MEKNNILKVCLLWGIVVISFVLFWITHRGISQYQNFIEPENYSVRAKYYNDRGEPQKAMSELEKGFQSFKPISSESLLLWKKIQEEMGNKNDAIHKISIQYEVIKVLETCSYAISEESGNTVIDNTMFNSAILEKGIASQFIFSQISRSVLRSSWKLLTRNAWKCLQNLQFSDEQILNFLYYSGAIFDFKIGSTDVVPDNDIFAISEGSAEGGGAQIWFQGRNYGGHRRGFYVLILTPPPCKIYRSDRFDVWESRSEAEKMVQFLEEIPDGYIGVFAVADEASENITEKLEHSLINFGFAKKTYVRREPKLFGYSYAFVGIGVKGANEGTAVQNWAKYDSSRKIIPVAICGIIKGGNNK